MSKSEKNEPANCPICSEPRDMKYRPFCSKRCADIDLNRWLTGQYAIPVEEDEPDDYLGEKMDEGAALSVQDDKLN